MKWIHRILRVLAVCTGMVATAIPLQANSQPAILGAAKPFAPTCAAADAACAAWVTFRRSHPFPYQAIAAGNLPDGKVVVVVSEPPPRMERAALDQLAKSAFGPSSRVQRNRWMIGVDGWLEDLVVSFERPPGDDANAASFLRDGTALLASALFGTTFGTEVEQITQRRPGELKLASASYHVTPKELGTWMRDASLAWQPVRRDAPAAKWSELVSRKAVGAFASTDATLVVLTFPTALLGTNPGLESLRVPFREFAIASEGIVGGLWTRSGQLAIVARARTTSQHTAAPLRFETFARLVGAARETDELGQSYERRQPFAGKLMHGPFESRDWAPIYLSPHLVNTEFGALLNITDQMLKSWSLAGEVEYLYFDYSKPGVFPFGKQPLSDIIHKQTGERSLLFNWNTAGSAVVMQGKDQSLITSVRSGALPVTYGAGGKTAAQGGATLYAHEDKAYDYFSGLRDPNLQRVVQYTVLYQLLRGATEGQGASTADGTAPDPSGVAAVKAGRGELVAATRAFLRDFSARPAAFAAKPQARVLARFMAEHKSLGEERIAGMLADRNSPDAKLYLKKLTASLVAQRDGLLARGSALEKRIHAYNALVEQARTNVSRGKDPGVTVSQLSTTKGQIEAEEKGLAIDLMKFQASTPHNPLAEAMGALSALADRSADAEVVRARYVKAFEHEPRDAIRTPSIVLSWHGKDHLTAVGGHNLDSRAVRLEVAPEITGIELKTAPDGATVLRYNPGKADAVESAAPKLARALEHRSERDVARLQALLSEAVAPRPRATALLIDNGAAQPEAAPVFARLGDRVYQGKEAFVEDLRTMAGQNDCCMLVIHDANRTAFVAEPNLKPPPAAIVRQVFDTPSLMSHLESFGNRPGRTPGGNAAIFLDQPPGFVDAIVKSMKPPSTGTEGAVRTMTGGGGSRPPNGRSTYIAQPDFDGKRSWLQNLDGPIQGARSKVAHVLGLSDKVPGSAWKSAKVDVLSRSEVDTLVASVGWDAVRDGVPVGVKVALEPAASLSGRDMALVAGVEQARPTTSAALKAATEQAAANAGERAASAGEYLGTIKSRLATLDDQQVRRLVLISRSADTTLYFSELELPRVLRELHALRRALA